MDGADANETCQDDVYYLDGRGPADCENCRGDAAPDDGAQTTSVASTEQTAVPLPGVLAVFAGLAVAVLLIRRAA